jgi:hypothetical protein
MKKLINLCCFINIDLTDPNIKKVNGKLFCNERIGEYNIARRLSRSIGSDLNIKNIINCIVNILILKTIQNKFCSGR